VLVLLPLLLLLLLVLLLTSGEAGRLGLMMGPPTFQATVCMCMCTFVCVCMCVYVCVCTLIAIW
jgi:hypothetical protein